jgi:hypothetical protein
MSSLFLAGYKKIGFALQFMVFGFALALREAASFYFRASASELLPSWGSLKSDYKRIGFALHFPFSGPLQLPSSRPPSIFAPARLPSCHPREVV